MFNIMCSINLQAQKLFFNYFHLQIEDLKTNTNIETILYLLNSQIYWIFNSFFSRIWDLSYVLGSDCYLKNTILSSKS